MITAEKVGNRIHLTFPYDASLVTKAKRVPGAAFSKSGGAHWSYGLHMRVCRMLREQFGDDLQIGPELLAWAMEARLHEVEMENLSTASDAPLDRLPSVAPVLAQAMNSRTYQRVGARFVSTGRSVLVADQPGLGKTLEAIGGIIESGMVGPILILSLKTAMHAVWEPELVRWVPENIMRCTIVDGPKAKRESLIDSFWSGVQAEPELLHFMVVNPEMIRTKRCQDGKVVWYEHNFPGLFLHKWNGVVIDESAHNQSSLICASAREDKMSQFRLGAKHLPVADNGIKVALSGTPMRGKPKNLWGTLNWLRPDLYTSFWKWVEMYFDLYDVWVGHTKHVEIGELKHADKLHSDLREIMLRRTKSEVAADLPPKQYGGTLLDPSDPSSPVGVWVPLNAQQKKAYDGMVKNAAVELEGGSLMANGILAELTRLKQFASTYGAMVDGQFVPSLPSNKFDAVVSMLEERGITGDPAKDEGDSQVVIASQFTQTIDVFAKGLRELGIQCHVLTGATKGDERTRIIKEFQSETKTGGPRVFLLNTRAGGVAVTLDKADDLFVLDETWIPDDQEQVEDRIHRVSRIHQVTIYYIRSLGTLEEGIARTNMSADDLQKELMDARRGVNVTRVLLGGK